MDNGAVNIGVFGAEAVACKISARISPGNGSERHGYFGGTYGVIVFSKRTEFVVETACISRTE